MRKIIHIDMDAFYASIEQRDNDAYKNKPLVVGGKSGRSVIAAASYEARKFGIYSAMPAHMALQKYPDLIFVAPRFDLYRNISQHIHSIFLEYTDLVEPLSLDEAFLDVTQNHKGIELATTIAQEIKARIKNELSLTSSAGISFNKFLSKIASDYRKPDGLFIIHPQIAQAFVEQLHVECFYGVGKVTAKKMHQLGIRNGRDLKARSREELIHHFGKAGENYYLYARATDHRIVDPNRIRKSVGVEETFSRDIQSLEKIRFIIKELSIELSQRIQKNAFLGRTLTLKIKYFDFKQITRSHTTNFCIGEDELIIQQIAEELLKLVSLNKSIRLIGLAVQNIDLDRHELNNEMNQMEFQFGLSDSIS